MLITAPKIIIINIKIKKINIKVICLILGVIGEFPLLIQIYSNINMKIMKKDKTSNQVLMINSNMLSPWMIFI